MQREFRIGCSGYYYGYWKPDFYPKEVKQRDWLHHYSTIFNTVELNGTFYRQPELKSLLKNYDAVAGDFLFSAKMSRYITHIARLHNCEKEISEFQDLLFEGLKDKMACFLFQMPPSFHYNEENLERVLKHIKGDEYNVIEFRHHSWWNESAVKQLKKAGVNFCNVDFPGIKEQAVDTGKIFYMRFHGTPVLFRSAYSKIRLEKFTEYFPDKKKRNFIYFNNTDNGNAYKNAAELMSILKVSRTHYIVKD